MSIASELILPSPFALVTLREAGDPMQHAAAIALRSGAGTLVWARRFDIAEFAVVLEPEEPLRLARRAVYAGANALVDTLAALAPPERAVTLDWPDAVRVDGALVGGVRLAWPDIAEDAIPDWIVFGASVRTVVMQAGDAGLRPLLGGLDEQGFEELSPSAVLETWTRYFLLEMSHWSELGFDGVRQRWLHSAVGETIGIHQDGDAERGGKRLDLAEALRTPSWLDPATGVPWI